MSLQELKKREAERLNIESGIEIAKKEVDDECVGIIAEFSDTKGGLLPQACALSASEESV